MKNTFRYFLTCWSVLFMAASCISIDSTINLNRNGSGTMVVTMMMTRESADSINKMQQKTAGSNTGAVKSDKNPFGKDEFQKKTTSYGSDVKLESYDAVSNEKYIGGKAVYSFKNIEQLSMNPFPQNNQKADSKDNTSFKFQNTGDSSKLVIIHSTDKSTGTDTPKKEKVKMTDEQKKQQMNMMKGFLKDMAISMKIKVNGKILRTDAANVQDNVVTLINIDFNNILADSDLVAKLNENPDDKNSLAKFNGIKGIVFESKPLVTVEFK